MPTTEQPYEAGFSTGGKFRKRPLRRTHAATPYDRPPTALRNPTADSNGWLSKLVDPAHRLINAGARRLFSSIFRKRLPPAPPPPSPEASQEPMDEHKEAVSPDSAGAQEACVNSNINPSSKSNNGGLTELEQIVKQKTFTRSEVDRLTNLLRLKSDEMSIGSEEKKLEDNRFEVIPSNLMVLHDRKEGHPNTPQHENGFQNHLISIPVLSKTVIDEDAATPAELAKAFMGSRASKVSPSMSSLCSQSFRDDSTVISNLSFLPKSPKMSLVQRNRAAIPKNVFSTPRSQGRSAIYNMARTPYSRVQQTSTIKGSGTMITLYGERPSSVSSQYEGELNMPSGSQQGSLKRRSSVLENGIGSIGPLRRIRQKSEIISQKGVSSPVSSQHHPPSVKMLTEKGDTGNSSSFTPVASKSKEMASKILAHLEKLTPKGKSPTKLSPSMLRGKALRSLENPDSSKVFENVHHDNKLNGLVNFSALDAQQSAFQKSDQNGSSKFMSLIDKVATETGINDTYSVKDTLPTVNANSSGLKHTVSHSQQKKQSFKMSAHEDFLNLDDDIIPNGIVSTPSTEASEKRGYSVSESKTTVLEPFKSDKPPAFCEERSLSGSILNHKPNLGASERSVVTVKNTSYASPFSSSMTVQPAAVFSQTSFTSGEDIFSKESIAPNPIISFGDKMAVAKEPSAASTFGISSKIADKVPQPIFTFSSSPTDSSTIKLENSSSPKTGSLSSFVTLSTGPTVSAPKVSEPAEAFNEDSPKFEVISKIHDSFPVSTSTVAGICAFGAGNNSILNNGSFSCFSSTPSATLISSNTAISSSSLPVFTPVSSFSASPVFKFGSSLPSSSDVPASGDSAAAIMEPKVNLDASFGSTSTTLFGVLATASSMGSSIFGLSAAAPSTADSQSQGSTPFGSISVSPSSAGAMVTQSMAVQFGSSGTSPLFGSSGSSAISPVSSLYGASSPAATLFSSSSGNGLGSSASSSESNTVSSSNGTASGIFGSSWQQPTKSPIFAPDLSTTASSTLFSFGATAASSTVFSSGASAASSTVFSFGSSVPSSTVFSFGSSVPSTAATNSAPMPFGSSTPSGAVTNSAPTPFGSTTGGTLGSPFSFTATTTGSSNGSSSGPGFSFTSAPPKTASQPVFGSPNPVFGFGSPPSSNDQMNMEENSMAEDAVQASTPTVPTFSQQPFSPAPSSFVFGSTGANPFQFGGQQNLATQQQASPFQASGSLDFNASGNFSLGTGGGDKSNRKIVKVKGKNRRK